MDSSELSPQYHALKEQLEQIPGYESKEVVKKLAAPMVERRDQLHQFGNLVHQSSRFISRLDRGVHTLDPDVRQAFEGYATSFDNPPVIAEIDFLKPEDQEKKRIRDLKDKRDRIVESQTRQQEFRQVILDYLQEYHGNYLELVSHIGDIKDPEKRQQVRQQILDQVIQTTADFVRAKGGIPTVSIDKENQAVGTIAQSLLHLNPEFSHLRSAIEMPAGLSGDQSTLVEALDLNRQSNIQKLSERQKQLPPIQQLIAEMENDVDAYTELFSQNPEFRNLFFRQWVLERKQDQARGIKIFRTPFYDRLIRFSIEQGDMENGIGGKIYYGPPGTGKSEMAVEINRLEGFESRVVSMHYWTSFSHLFGEALLQVGQDKQMRQAAGISSLSAVSGLVDSYQGDGGAQQFWGVVEQAAQRSNQPLGQFIQGFYHGDSEIARQIESGNISDTVKRQVMNSFRTSLHARAVATAEGKIEEPSDEDETSWVKGEILLAIDHKERVVLDELDKAGPGSIDSLHALLAWSPGQKAPLKLRGLEVGMPEWFRIDATANEMNLDDERKSALYNRFKQIFVDYPPVKDEMMLASVWMADQSGVMRIDPLRQTQLAAFFQYEVPAIRALYENELIAQPFTLRNTKEFCNLVVSPTSHQDRGEDLDQIVRQELLEQRQFYANNEQRASLLLVINGMEQMLLRPNPLLPSLDLNTGTGDLEPTNLREQRVAAVTNFLESVTHSPFYSVATGLPETIGLFSGKSLAAIDRTRILKSQLARVQLTGETSEELLASGSTYPEPLIQVTADTRDSRTARIFHSAEVDGSKVVLLEHQLPIIGGSFEVTGQSQDGGTFMVKTKNDQGKTIYEVWEFGYYEAAPTKTNPNPKPAKNHIIRQVAEISADRDSTITLSSDGDKVFKVEKNGDLLIHLIDQERDVTLDTPIERYEVSPDSRTLLIETAEGETRLYDLTKLSQVDRLTYHRAIVRVNGRGLQLVGDKLIKQPGSNVLGLIQR